MRINDMLTKLVEWCTHLGMIGHGLTIRMMKEHKGMHMEMTIS